MNHILGFKVCRVLRVSAFLTIYNSLPSTNPSMPLVMIRCSIPYLVFILDELGFRHVIYR